nr:hypothetical protein [Micromonospora sp. DSM 115978]
EPALRPAVQGISDMFMNAAAAVGGALAGVVVATASYAALGLLTFGLLAVGTVTAACVRDRQAPSTRVST